MAEMHATYDHRLPLRRILSGWGAPELRAMLLKACPWLIAAAMATGQSLALAGGEPQIVGLETSALRLEIQTAPTPFVQRLVHKASGQSVIAEPAHKSLFSIVLAKADGSQQTIDSAQADESSARLKSGHGERTLIIQYAKFPGLGLAVEVTVESRAESPLTFWSMRVQNAAPWRIKAVRFPQLLAVPSICDGADDCLVLPALPGTLIENPGRNWRNGQSVTLSYPGNLSAQFFAYQDRSAGLYLAGTDTLGYPMSFCVTKQQEGFRCWHEYQAVSDAPDSESSASEPSDDWRTPYPIAVGVAQGGWYDSADQYKQWAVRQPWCARKLVERDDIPAWWKDGPAVHVLEVRKYDGTRTCTGSYYPQLVDHLRTFRDKIDGPIVAMLAGWENHRRWTAGDYFPAFDADTARSVISQLKQEGFRPFLFLSGLFYTFANEGPDAGEIPAAEEHRAAYVLDAATGKPKQYVLNESNPSGQWKRNSYQFCVGTPQAHEFFHGVVDQTQALGIDVMQMDQTTTGAGDACASAEHAHARGVGLYQSREFWRLLDGMRQQGKRRSADFVLFHEEPHEQLIPHVDGFHVREYYEKRWYRSYPGAVGIPLFSYLYHEYAIGYGGDSAGLSKNQSPWNVRCHAMNLVSGRTPGAAIWSSHQNMNDAHADQIAMIRNHCRLLKTRAKDFLMLGEMLHPFELPVARLPIVLPVQRDDRWVNDEIPTPAILSSSWRSPSGGIGHLFVNIAADSQPLQVQLDTRNAPADKSYDAEIYRSTAGDSFRPLWEGQQMPREITAELEPLEVVFIELRPSGESL